jgi:hypothetical protein
MKKEKLGFGIFILAILFGFVAAFTLVSCDDGDNDTTHTCSFGGWTTKTEATCNAAKVEKRTCSCGKEETQNVGEPDPALHVWGAWTTPGDEGYAATCTTDGKGKQTCTNASCGTINPETTIPKLSQTGEHTADKPATCMEKSTCTVCEVGEFGDFDLTNHDTTCPATFIITGTVDPGFTAKRTAGCKGTIGTADSAIADVIDAIKADADGANCTIQFGDGSDTLDVEGAQVLFANAAEDNWGHITLTGKITGNNSESAAANQGIIRINGPSATISGEGTSIANTGTNANYAKAVYFNSASPATLTITGGNFSIDTGYAIHNQDNGTIEISGNTTASASANSSSNSRAVSNQGSGTITITSGEFSGSSATNAGVVYNNTGTLNISNAKIRVASGIGVRNNTGTININNCEISTTTSSVYGVYNFGGKMSITGGTIISVITANRTLFQELTHSGTNYFRVIGTDVTLNEQAASQEVVEANRGGTGAAGILWHTATCAVATNPAATCNCSE